MPITTAETASSWERLSTAPAWRPSGRRQWGGHSNAGQRPAFRVSVELSVHQGAFDEHTKPQLVVMGQVASQHHGVDLAVSRIDASDRRARQRRHRFQARLVEVEQVVFEVAASLQNDSNGTMHPSVLVL